MTLHVVRTATRLWLLGRSAALVAIAAVCVAFTAPRTEAATAFWYGVSGSNWSTATNWNSVSSGTGSYTPVNGDSLRWFQSSTNSRISNNDIVGLSVAGVSFQSTTGTYTLSGNKLTLTAGLTSVAASLVNINMPLELNASAVSFQGGADALKLNAVISETGGSRQLQVSTGTVTLGADNSFSNGIMVGINAVAAVRVGSIANIGVNQPLGSGTLVILGQSDGHGTLIYSGTGDVSTNKRLQVGRLDSGTGGTAIVRNDGSGVITWNGAQNAANLASNRTFILGGTNAGANTWAAAIVNNGSNGIVNFTKQDAGRWILSAANTYSGTTTVAGGVLGIANNLALQNSPLATSGAGTVTLTVTTPTFGGLVGATDLASVITSGYGSVTNLTLNPGAGQSFTYSGALADGAAGMTLTKTGSGTQVLAGLNSYTGATTVSAGTLDLGVTGSFAGGIANAASLLLTQVGAGDAHVGGLISGAGTVTVGGTGAVRLANAGNTYTGDTIVAGGVLVADGLAAAGAASPLGSGTFVHLGSAGLPGTLRFTGAASGSTNRRIQLSGSTANATIEANGSVPLVLTGSIGAAAGSKTLTLSGTSIVANTIGAIPDPTTAGSLGVVKDGPGLWRLTGTSAFTGGLTVKNGTLVAAVDAGATTSDSGAFGSNFPVVGDTAGGATGTAALLAEAGVFIRGDITVASGPASQVVLIGGASATGTATFSGGKNLGIGRDVAIVATGGGVVTFAKGWVGSSGPGSTPTANVAIGADGYTGIVRLSTTGTLATSGSVSVRYGTAVLGQDTILDGAGTLTIDAPATLGGIGTVAAPLGGAGLVAPGNSPGILTAEALDPTGGLDLAFEFTGTAPTYSSAASSVNDVLRLTGTSPFLGQSLASGNVISLYLPAGAATGGVFIGGFFTDMTSSSFSTFLNTVSSGSYVAYYENSGGAFSYGGLNYSLLADLGKSVQVGTTTAFGTTNFQNGGPAIDGQVTTFTVVVPEPAAFALAGIGIAAGVAWTLRRRAAAGRPDRDHARRPADG